MNNFLNDDIESALRCLQQGKTILYPTDTIWGIGCDATSEEAVNKIIEIKQRPAAKSFVVLVADEKDILHYTASPDLGVFDYIETVEKPVTVIFEHAIGLAENVCAPDGSVAIRICKDEFCRHLIKRFKKPIVSTSANISGENAPSNFLQVNPIIKSAVDYVVQFRQDDLLPTQPSRIVKWKNGKAEIIRP